MPVFADAFWPWAAWQRWVGKHIEDAEQVRMQYASTRNSAITAILAAFVPTVYYWGRVDHWISVLWLSCFASTLAIRGLLQHGFDTYMQAQQGVPLSAGQVHPSMPRWASLHALSVFSTGLFWGLSIWVFNPQNNFNDAMVALVTLTGALLSGLFIFANFFPARLAYCMGIFIPSSLGFALQGPSRGSAQSTAYALLSVLLLVFFLAYGRNQGRKFVETIRMRHEREKLLQELQAENLAKQQALAQAHEATAAKTRFFAAISHDVRQPLYSLSLLAGTATSAMSDAQRQKLQQNIQHSVGMLDSLFTQLLQVSQLDAGALQPNMQAIELKAFIQATVQTFSVQLEQKKGKLSLDIVDARVMADPVWLQRIVLNLVGNALTHASPYAPPTMLRVSAINSGEHIVLSVQDNGPGIAPTEQEKIFEEFYRISSVPKSAQTTAAQTTPLQTLERYSFGLGLPIVRRLARAMGSDVLVQSQPGQGSTFSLQLTVAPPPLSESSLAHAHERADTQVMEAVAMPSSSSLLNGALIGVVEDDENVGHALHTLLESWGAKAYWVRHSEEALQWQTPLDALVVDYQLTPQDPMNGAQVATALRQRWQRNSKPPLPVLVASSLNLNAQQTAGFDALVKPLTPMKLRAWLLNALALKKLSS
jgi:two-component system, sensor histidine kinase